MKKLLSTIWGCIYPLLIYIGIALITEFFSEDILLNTGIVNAVSIPVMILLMKHDVKRGVSDIRKNDVTFTTYVVYALAGAVLSILLNFVIDKLGISINDKGLEMVNGIIASSPVALQVAVAVIVAPVLEELLYRGVIYKRIRGSYGAIVAATVSSLIFGVMHGNISQGLYAFIIGLFLAAAYEKTGRISVACIMHMVANLASLVNM